MVHASDSAEQRQAENYAIRALSLKLGVKLLPQVIPLGCSKVQIDGCDEHRSVFAEVYSGIGTPKPGQIKKVLTDAFKLISLENSLGRLVEKHLCFIDKESLDYFANEHWYSDSCAALGIKLTLVELPVNIFGTVQKAKERQGLLFKKLPK